MENETIRLIVREEIEAAFKRHSIAKKPGKRGGGRQVIKIDGYIPQTELFKQAGYDYKHNVVTNMMPIIREVSRAKIIKKHNRYYIAEQDKEKFIETMKYYCDKLKATKAPKTLETELFGGQL